MRVFFDHDLPHKLRTEIGLLSQHEIVTASYMGWLNLKGELLRMAEESGFEVFVTGDQTLIFEQNLTGRQLAILILSVNNWPITKIHIRDILAAIDNATPGSFQAINCGLFSRRHPVE